MVSNVTIEAARIEQQERVAQALSDEVRAPSQVARTGVPLVLRTTVRQAPMILESCREWLSAVTGAKVAAP